MVKIHGTIIRKCPIQNGFNSWRPGAIGSLKTCAEELSQMSEMGVVEALQSKYSIAELIEELYSQIIENCPGKATLIGHSWGAWLAALFAEKHPEVGEKVVLVGCPPLADEYVKEISARRLQNLSDEESEIFQRLVDNTATDEDMKKIPSVLEKSDNYCLSDREKQSDNKTDSKMYNSLWSEAAEMRILSHIMQTTN